MQVAFADRDRPLPPLPRSRPAEVAGLVSELMAKDPPARPASAGQVASARKIAPPGSSRVSRTRMRRLARPGCNRLGA
jgi:hypothetical protein